MSETSIFHTKVPPRVDFNKGDYETLIYQKGREVLFEKSLQCPCKSPSTNQQSNCRNCGGTGWVFINPKKTRMVVQGVSFTSDFKAWSEESRGMINITCSDTELLSYMDRITLLDGMAIYSEAIELKQKGSYWFFHSSYPIKNILYLGVFESEDTQIYRIDERNGISITNNLVRIEERLLPPNLPTYTTITIRYQHPPVYYIMEMKRETMQSFKFQGGVETNQNLPLSAVGRRAHYMLTPININGVDIIDNSYIEPEKCYKI